MVIDATNSSSAEDLAVQLTSSDAARSRGLRVTPCTDVPDVSGAMVFEVRGDDPAAATDSVAPGELADLALLGLGRRLLGAHLVASWATAADPHEARRRLAEVHWDGPVRDLGHRYRMPATCDVPFVRVCTECRADVALVREERRFARTGHRRADWLCEDCRRREERGPDDVRLATQVRQEVSRQVGRTLTAPAMFTDLSCAADPRSNGGPRRSGALSPQVATIAADVNGLGSLMARLHTEGDHDHARRISEALTDASQQALTAGCVAAVEALPGTGMLPAVPHVLGGDDLLVTVVADAAWPLLRRVHEVFADPQGTLGRVTARAGHSAVQLSLGVVFSHAELPVSQQIEAADVLLKRAKSDHRGDVSSVLWLDATTEGLDPVPDRVAWPVDRLSRGAEAIGALRALPPTTRRTLVEDLADPDPLLACGLLRHRLTRHDRGLDEAIRAVTDTLDRPCRDVLNLPLRTEPHSVQAAAQLRRTLHDALSLARWWR